MPKPKNATEKSIRNTYLSRLRSFLREIYKDRSSTTEVRGEKHQRLAGFVEAALISRVLTKPDIQSVIDGEHQKAYGLTIKERRSIQQQILAACEDDDWSPFEEPTFWRRKPNRTVRRTQLDKRSPMKDVD